ncbi:nucleoside 2-deoxyribosyltransferase [Aeromonas jandaei]|uniref:DUF4406 domain-containing protein n=1 Tax=Aeromonas jandaei TaxID=650 RepID=UPI000CE16CF9|nr:DUF4406 domain-containing protein [Aeromonas jandaei]PPA30476.1 nucleoside 2-deoxyribosyltransferase [Aeromonas jandaei]
MNVHGKIVYLAGPITGALATYRQTFAEGERHLTQEGAVVLNPAMLPIGLRSHTSYMNICLPMLREADVVVLLPGWQESEGVAMEIEEAAKLGIPTTPLSTLP